MHHSYSKDILQKLLQSTDDITVAIDMDWESYWRLRDENPLNDAETLKMQDNAVIKEIGKKPKSLDEIEGQYMGLIKLSDKGVKQMKRVFHAAVKKGVLLNKDVKNLYMTDLLQAMIEYGYKVSALPIYGGKWIEVDTVKDLKNPITRKRLEEISCG